VRRGVRRCPGGAYIGSREEGKGLPVAMAINGHAALMGNQEGGFKEWKRWIDGGEVKSGLHCVLKKRIEGRGTREPAGNDRRP
jgi:hypothetical protein